MAQKNYKNNPKYRKEVRKWKKRKADELRREGDILAGSEGDTQDLYLIRHDDTLYQLDINYHPSVTRTIWVVEYLGVQKVKDMGEYCEYATDRISLSDPYDEEEVMGVIRNSSIPLVHKGMNRHCDIYLRTVRQKIKVRTQTRRHKLEPPTSLKISGAL